MNAAPETNPLLPRDHRRIVFPPINVADFLALQTHFEDVARELQLIEVGGHLGEDIPIHVSTLTEALTRGLTAMRNEARRQAMTALYAGDVEFRLEVELPVNAPTIVRAMIDLIDETDRCSDRGVLLTPTAPPGARRALQAMVDHFGRERSPARTAPDEAPVVIPE
jgi:hypothetical protein